MYPYCKSKFSSVPKASVLWLNIAHSNTVPLESNKNINPASNAVCPINSTTLAISLVILFLIRISIPIKNISTSNGYNGLLK